ncbi:MAG: HAD-IB family hydrolase [Gammaproteobacteria bacterium]|nr:HAD-IB family hydrolase [Gammaproteobacteria bacterium]
MEPYQSLTADINEGPGGKTTAAFFDLDGTIIATHSVKDIFIERLFAGQVQTGEVVDMATMMLRYAFKTADFEDSLRESVNNMQGMDEGEFLELAEKVCRDRLLPQVFPEVKAIIKAHKKKGHSLVVVTSASRYQVEPLARELGIDNIICTELEVKDGEFTGKLDGSPCYGPAKLSMARAFSKGRRISLKKSYFYSNGSEDIPLLEAVGNPVAIGPDSKLKKTATEEGWPIHEFDSRGWIGIGDVARTLATFGTALPTYAAGLPFRYLGGTSRDTTNLSLAVWSSMATMIARLKLLVEGDNFLFSHRPAVFIFNHQSAMDMLITAKLLREDIVGVAKKEVQSQPLIGPVLKFAGTVFVDRSNVGDPRAALEPAIEALEEGKSVVIAPEGTRSKDGTLGDFKRGAFHLARQAGVPIVPIVIHNAVDALPNKSMVIRPAEVKVTVLEPIDTSEWTLRSVAPETRRIREMYLKTLSE